MNDKYYGMFGSFSFIFPQDAAVLRAVRRKNLEIFRIKSPDLMKEWSYSEKRWKQSQEVDGSLISNSTFLLYSENTCLLLKIQIYCFLTGSDTPSSPRKINFIFPELSNISTQISSDLTKSCKRQRLSVLPVRSFNVHKSNKSFLTNMQESDAGFFCPHLVFSGMDASAAPLTTLTHLN